MVQAKEWYLSWMGERLWRHVAVLEEIDRERS
jgi:hypothetical protein